MRLVHQRPYELHPPPVAAAELSGFIIGAVLQPEPRKLFVDACLRHRARHTVQAGVEH